MLLLLNVKRSDVFLSDVREEVREKGMHEYNGQEGRYHHQQQQQRKETMVDNDRQDFSCRRKKSKDVSQTISCPFEREVGRKLESK